MENKLKSAFEYQRFENNSRLAGIINGVENRYTATELDDEELFFVNAAGVFDFSDKNREKK